MQEEITNMRNISKRGVQWTRCGRGAGAAGAVRVQSVCDGPDTHGASAPDISTASSSVCSCSLVTRRRLHLRKREFTLEEENMQRLKQFSLTSLTVSLYV